MGRKHYYSLYLKFLFFHIFLFQPKQWKEFFFLIIFSFSLFSSSLKQTQVAKFKGKELKAEIKITSRYEWTPLSESPSQNLGGNNK